jgi:Zn-dependent protease
VKLSDNKGHRAEGGERSRSALRRLGAGSRSGTSACSVALNPERGEDASTSDVSRGFGVSTPVEGGRGLRVRLFGFPVHIDLSFVVIMGLLGWLNVVHAVIDVVLWLGIATVAVLVHELGHAVTARGAGAHPAIALTGFGGLTTYVPPRPLSRGRSLSIAVAGPFAGLAAGGLLYLARQAVDPEPFGLADRATYYGLITTIGWSVLNLVPVLPLDGGQAMREVLPGTPEQRARRAAMVSIVVLVPLIGAAVLWNQPFIALFLLFYGVANVQALRTGPGTEANGDTGPAVSPEQAVVGLLWQGAPVQARGLLESLPPGAPVDLAVHGAVLAATDQPEQGFALLAQELGRRPGDPNVVALLVLSHTLRHDWAAVEADLAGSLAPGVPLPVVERAIQEAAAAGRPDVAQRLAALPVRGPQAG